MSAPRSTARRHGAAARTWLARGAFGGGLLALLWATPHCLWDGLDDYSRDYGKTSTDDGGASTSTTDTTSDAAVDSPVDATSDAPCQCAEGQECVAEQCETCTSTWTYDHKGLLFNNVFSVSHVFDPERRRVYVSSIRAGAGVGENHGYLADLSVCRGTLLHEHDGDPVEGAPLPALSFMALSAPSASPNLAGQLFAGLHASGVPKPPPLGGFARYEPETGQFKAIVNNVDSVDPTFELQGAWGLAATPQAVWTSGFRQSGGVFRPAAIRWDGVKFCNVTIPNVDGYTTRALSARGDQVIFAGDASGGDAPVKVWIIDDTKSDQANCAWSIDATIPPVPVTRPLVMAVRLVSNSIVVAGIASFDGMTATTWSGFVAQLILGETEWRIAKSYPPGVPGNGFIGLDSDGSNLYVGAFRDYALSTPASSSAETLVYSLPLLTDAAPIKTISVPGLGSVFNLDLDGDGMILSGYRKGSGADGRTVRCTLEVCP